MWALCSPEQIRGEVITISKLLVTSCEVLKFQLGEKHERTQETLQDIISLYEAWNKPAETERYRKLTSS